MVTRVTYDNNSASVVSATARVGNLRRGRALFGFWRPARDTVRLWLPQACLHWHSGIRVAAFLGDPHAGDPADFTSSHNLPLG